MAYSRPPLFQRVVFDRLAMRYGISGAQTLQVPRRGGGVQRVPVIPVEYDGASHLVSTRGESLWVRNLRAAGFQGAIQKRDGVEPFRAVEVPVAERPAIIDAYRAKAGRAVESYFKKLPDPADHPVFRIEDDAVA
jgi:hypothetical protein